MRAYALATLAWLLVPCSISAQSASGSDDGTTTIGAFNTEFGVLQLNTVDESAKLKFGRYLFDRSQHLHWINVSAGAKAEDGIASLFGDGVAAPGFTSDLRLGLNVATSDPVDETTLNPGVVADCKEAADGEKCVSDYMDAHPVSSTAYGVWFTLGTGFESSAFKLYDPGQPYGSQVAKDRSFRPRVDAGINFWRANVLHSSAVGGLTIGMKRDHNFDDLQKEEIEEVTSTTSLDGTEVRRRVRRTTAYSGAYDEFTVYPFNADLVIAPHRATNLAFNIQSRLNWRRDDPTEWNTGVGLLFLRDRNPLNPLGGVFLFADDVMSDEFAESSFWDRARVSLVLNIPVPRIR